jgi:2,4-dienoyl-CoA reductase-like NADH-dependent reductase (Old Yellow Enzyme family)
LDEAGIRAIVRAFGEAAGRALKAGFRVLEIHAAHGYLLHSFLSPLSNHRQDAYGGSFEHRTRIVHEVLGEIRSVWPERYPLFLRISATDYAEGGWDPKQSVKLARQVQPLGVDLVDCSFGGLLPHVAVPFGPGYQAAFAERIKKETGILTGAVGMITAAEQAEHVLRTEQADVVVMAREAAAASVLAAGGGTQTGRRGALAEPVFEGEAVGPTATADPSGLPSSSLSASGLDHSRRLICRSRFEIEHFPIPRREAPAPSS